MISISSRLFCFVSGSTRQIRTIATARLNDALRAVEVDRVLEVGPAARIEVAEFEWVKLIFGPGAGQITTTECGRTARPAYRA